LRRRARWCRRRWYERGTRHAPRRRRQPIRREFGARAANEILALLGRKLELGRQQGGDLTRRAALVRLDLLDCPRRAANAASQFLLGQIERSAALAQPIAE
jgi:hypothetical protein